MRFFIHRPNRDIQEGGKQIQTYINGDEPVAPRKDWEEAAQQSHCRKWDLPDHHEDQFDDKGLKGNFHTDLDDLFQAKTRAHKKITAQHDIAVNRDLGQHI